MAKILTKSELTDDPEELVTLKSIFSPTRVLTVQYRNDIIELSYGESYEEFPVIEIGIDEVENLVNYFNKLKELLKEQP